MAAKSSAGFVISIAPSNEWRKAELAFLECSNLAASKRLRNIASLNAAKKFVVPMRAAAPKNTGRLRRAVAARRAKYQAPGAVVGIRAGASRESQNGAWYRWFVTTGRYGQRATKNGIKTVKRVPANPFVIRTTNKNDLMNQALETYADTIQAFFNNEAFNSMIMKWKRGK
jgi:hypothetical protein